MAVTQAQAWQFPDAFVGKATLSAYQPNQALAAQASQYSSIAPASAAVAHWFQPTPVAVSNIVLQNSLNAIAASATSQASSGSEAFSYGYSAFLYSRQDYGANSSNLWPVLSGSFGLTATLTYTGTAQSFGMSWVTDSTGGTSNLTTSSNAAGWSAYVSGPRVINLPFVTTLTAGEYWLALQHSSSTATSNSNITLVSMSQLQPAGQQVGPVAGVLGALATGTAAHGGNDDYFLLTSTPVFSTTQAMSGGGQRPIWFALSNA